MKRKRADVADRKKRQKAQRHSSMLGGWRRALKRARAHPDYRPEWEAGQTWDARLHALVDGASRAAVLASWLLHAYLVHCGAAGEHVHVDQSLCRTALSLVSDTGTSDAAKGRTDAGAHLKRYYVEHFAPNLDATAAKPVVRGLGNAFAALAMQMVTNYDQLVSHLPRRCVKLVALVAGAKRYDVQRAWDRDSEALAALGEHADLLVALRDAHDAELHVPLAAEVLRRSKEAGGAGFVLFPLRAPRRHCISVDAALLKTWCAGAPFPLAAFFPKKRGRAGWTAAASFLTDGVACHFLYEGEATGVTTTVRSARFAKRDASRSLPERGLVKLEALAPDAALAGAVPAFDPGAVNLLTGSDGSQVTRERWRALLGVDARATRLERAKAQRLDVCTAEEAMSKASLLTSDAAELAAALSVHSASLAVLFDFYGSHGRALERMGASRARQRALAAVVNEVMGAEVAPGERPERARPVVAFGNGSWCAARKGAPPTPVTLLREHLARFGCVVLLDEYLTSKTCAACGTRMRLVVRDGAATRSFHCDQCAKDVDRDANAARNLLAVFDMYMLGRGRPEPLRRPTRH